MRLFAAWVLIIVFVFVFILRPIVLNVIDKLRMKDICKARKAKK